MWTWEGAWLDDLGPRDIFREVPGKFFLVILDRMGCSGYACLLKNPGPSLRYKVENPGHVWLTPRKKWSVRGFTFLLTSSRDSNSTSSGLKITASSSPV